MLNQDKFQSLQSASQEHLCAYASRCLLSLTSSMCELEDGWETKFVDALVMIHKMNDNKENKSSSITLEVKPLVPPIPDEIPLLLQSIQDCYSTMDKCSKQSFALTCIIKIKAYWTTSTIYSL